MDRFSCHLLASCDLVHFDSPRHVYGRWLDNHCREEKNLYGQKTGDEDVQRNQEQQEKNESTYPTVRIAVADPDLEPSLKTAYILHE